MICFGFDLRNTCFLVFVLLNISTCSAFSPYRIWNKNEFKIKVEPGVSECFFKSIANGSLFHISFQVIKGSDVNFLLTDHKGIKLLDLQHQNSGSHQIQDVEEAGDYEFCVDNTYSHMHEKIVYIYVLSFHSEKLKYRLQDEKEFNDTSVAITKGLSKIHFNMIDVVTQQAVARFRQSRDEYLIETNNELVLIWSLSQSVVILCCGLFQVYFIKRFFSLNSDSSKQNKRQPY